MSQEAVSSRSTALPAPEYHPDLLPPGTVVGDFRLLRHVATGSYGSVWQVESVERPGRHYALKFSLHRPGEGSVGDARAVREVQLLLRAAHENVVRVVAHGRWRDPDTGPHYVVLQWVEGGTLWQWARDARPSTRQVVRLCQKLARALQRAHEADVLHRDVEPDNVLVRAADGEPFLSDFGVGDARGAHSLTPGAVPPGTPAFHSPQLLASHLPGAAPYRAQPTDDWYALGVLLYELLTEVRPYPDEKQVSAGHRAHPASHRQRWASGAGRGAADRPRLQGGGPGGAEPGGAGEPQGRAAAEPCAAQAATSAAPGRLPGPPSLGARCGSHRAGG